MSMKNPSKSSPPSGDTHPDWMGMVPGSEAVLPLKPNPSAAYMVSDNTLLVTPPPTNAETKLGIGSGSIEVLFMRTSIEPQYQQVQLESREGETAKVTLGGFQMAPYTQELGRARMDVDSAINLATAILKHAVDQHGFETEVILTRLVDRGFDLTHISSK